MSKPLIHVSDKTGYTCRKFYLTRIQLIGIHKCLEISIVCTCFVLFMSKIQMASKQADKRNLGTKYPGSCIYGIFTKQFKFIFIFVAMGLTFA